MGFIPIQQLLDHLFRFALQLFLDLLARPYRFFPIFSPFCPKLKMHPAVPTLKRAMTWSSHADRSIKACIGVSRPVMPWRPCAR
jgi:hypothetical protein